MWQKEDYQEHMLGYLDGVQIEFEQRAHLHLRQHDLSEFYINLDIIFDCLWQLIESSDGDWERYRNALEDSYDVLLHTFYPVQYADSLNPSASLIYAEW